MDRSILEKALWLSRCAPALRETFAYRPYRAREKITLVDIANTRFHLDWRDVLTPEAFDDWLKEVTA